MMQKQQQKTLLVFVFCLIISTLFLLVCTKCSPLYATNDWVDPNAFFTMGKGMMEGLVPYRDLFEQKGPLLYLYHGLAYLMSHTTFIGVFLFEILNFSIFLLICYRTVRMFAPHSYALWSLPLLSCLLLNSTSFTYGDSAEEFCLPFIATGIYYMLRYYREQFPNPMKKRWLFLSGIMAGCIFWIKYSLLGFFFGWMVVLLFFLCRKNLWKQVLIHSAVFLGGMIVASVPWLIYFIYHNALGDMAFVYIWANFAYYPSEYGFFTKILVIIGQIIWNTVTNIHFTLLGGFGLYRFLKGERYFDNKSGKTALSVSIIFLTLGIFCGGRAYVYYYFMLAPFAVLGIIALYEPLRLLWSKLRQKKQRAAAISLTGLMVVCTALFNQNAYMMIFTDIHYKDTVQYRYARIINEVEEPTLLNYGYLDYGFYMAADIVPNVKYFENQNIPYEHYPDILDGQRGYRGYIEDSVTDFVVIRLQEGWNPLELDVPYLYENYELIALERQIYKNTLYKFALFQKKGITDHEPIPVG